MKFNKFIIVFILSLNIWLRREKKGRQKHTAKQKEQAAAAKRCKKEGCLKMVEKQSKGGRIEKSKSALTL